MTRRFRDARELQAFLERATFAAREAVGIELVEQAEELLAESRNRAPQDTDQMISNADISTDEQRLVTEAAVSYNEEYALYQHEGFYNPGPKTAAKLGGQQGIGRKFLENPFNENAARNLQRVRKAAERALRIITR